MAPRAAGFLHDSWQTGADPTKGATLMSFDAAVAWVVLPNVQIDLGANFGLTSATPVIQVYTGLSQRF